MSEEEVSELFIGQEDAQGNINYEGKRIYDQVDMVEIGSKLKI